MNSLGIKHLASNITKRFNLRSSPWYLSITVDCNMSLPFFVVTDTVKRWTNIIATEKEDAIFCYSCHSHMYTNYLPFKGSTLLLILPTEFYRLKGVLSLLILPRMVQTGSSLILLITSAITRCWLYMYILWYIFLQGRHGYPLLVLLHLAHCYSNLCHRLRHTVRDDREPSDRQSGVWRWRGTRRRKGRVVGRSPNRYTWHILLPYRTAA